MKPQNAKHPQLTRAGLTLLSLTMLLASCADQPKLQTVYINRPVTANLDLLCKPQAPLPPEKMDNGGLALYAQQVNDAIGECRKQNDAYRAEIERLTKRVK